MNPFAQLINEAGDMLPRNSCIPVKLAGIVCACLLAIAPLSTLGSAREDKAKTFPPAREIIDRALARAEWAKEQGFENRLVGEYTSIKEKLDDESGVKERSEIRYRVYPVDGYAYYERLVVDGEPLSEEELRKRKEDFRKEIAHPKPDEKKDDNSVAFNKDLVSRYRAEVVGEERINGRPAYVLAFEPKDGKLPVRRRMDHALNNSRGQLWIDQQDYGLMRVTFELIKPVKLWAGLLGKVGAVEGELRQTRLQEGVWAPKSLDLLFKGRVLFKSFHEKRQFEWQGLRIAPKKELARISPAAR